jgi:hypothetical protein
MNPASLPTTVCVGSYCELLSCLHASEHFGLGRYGDPVNPLGYQRGIGNMAQLLQPGGTFYLSKPIGQERVEFNAYWVFDPRSIVRCAEAAGMTLQNLIVITAANGPQEAAIDIATLAVLPCRVISSACSLSQKQSANKESPCSSKTSTK